PLPYLHSFPTRRSSDLNWSEGIWELGKGYTQPDQSAYHVVAYDFGVKSNILRILADKGCRLTVVPATTPVADVLALEPDGVFLRSEEHTSELQSRENLV